MHSGFRVEGLGWIKGLGEFRGGRGSGEFGALRGSSKSEVTGFGLSLPGYSHM